MTFVPDRAPQVIGPMPGVMSPIRRGARPCHSSLPMLTPSQLAELMDTGTVTIADDRHAIAGETASLDMLGLALQRLDASAARHHPARCPDCCEDLPEHHTAPLCDECAARRHELAA